MIARDRGVPGALDREWMGSISCCIPVAETRTRSRIADVCSVEGASFDGGRGQTMLVREC